MKKTLSYSIGASKLGFVLVAETLKGVVAVFLGDTKKELIIEFQKMVSNDFILEKESSHNLKEVLALIENPSQEVKLDLDIRGTDFQKKVWKALSKIKCGSTVSYKQLAEMIGRPKSARAVSNACGRNNLALIIPCHRVVRSNGAVSGYRWGRDRKKELLKSEGVQPV